MIIQNFDRSYQVMRYLGSTSKTEEFLCVETTVQGNLDCLLVCITDSVLAKNFTLYLEEKIKGREFTDYLESFQAQGKFYVVFQYSRNQSLAEKLQTEYCSLRERAEIARGLLERLLLLNAHPFFSWNALQPEQITVSRSLEIQLNYHLEQIENYEAYSMKEVALRLQSVLKLLFAAEEKKKLYPLLEDYLQELEQNKEWTYLDLYKNFMPVYEKLLEEMAENRLPQTFWFRLWNQTKKFLGFCKKLLAILLLVVTMWYVISVLQDDGDLNVMRQTMSQIGELTIENDEMSGQ